MSRDDYMRVGWGVHGGGARSQRGCKSHEEGFCGNQPEERDQLQFSADEINTLLRHVKSVEYLTKSLVEKGAHIDKLMSEVNALSTDLQNKINQAGGLVRDALHAKDQGDYAKNQGDYAKEQAERAKAIVDQAGNAPSGGNAESVCGYKIKVLFPDQYDPDKADADTIYFIIKEENIIAVPGVIELQYQIGGDGYTPVSAEGWIFEEEPTDCSDAGTYTFPISLLSGNTVWSDGTLGTKELTVVVKPLVIQCPNAITIRETGSVIPASALCQLPNGLTCSYIIKSGQSEMREAGTYIVELSLSNPNCVFADGNKHTMTVTVEERVTEAWKFGDAFPIVFGAPSVNPVEAWKFGSAFPIVFN